MAVDPIDHMEEAWSLDGNPFPAEAIRAENQPYSPAVFDDESREFRRKLIRGSVRGSFNVGFSLVAGDACRHRVRQDYFDARDNKGDQSRSRC